VVLITVDTLRADRLGCYGAERPATPHIDRLASEGTLFERAGAPMPMTRPSHFSMFTSSHPRDHGVVNNKLALGESRLTLPQLFQQAGYRTAGWVAVRLLAESSGAARGFDEFDAPSGANTRPADEVIPRVRDWIEAADPDEPFFVWVHLFDPHIPYAPAGIPPAARGAPDVHNGIDWPTLLRVAEANGGDVPRAVYERALDLYAGEVAHVDRWVGGLIETLDRRGLLDRSIVAFTADHGECFENGVWFEHGDCLFDGAVRVPLLVRFPAPAGAPAGTRRDDVVDLLDLAPTLLGLARLPVPETFQGSDLFAPDYAPRGTAFFQHPLYSEQQSRTKQQRERRLRSVMGQPTRPLVIGEEQLGLRTARWKLILTGERAELYDRHADPGERSDVAAAQPEVVARLRSELEAWQRAHPLQVEDASQVNPELLEMLRELGYAQ
jgi:arylsulfatase A-like enzyme